MNDIFAPYETLYESNTKQYGNINLANNRAKMLEELPQGGGFSKLPFYCYAYDSIFSQATHLNVPSYSSGEAIINGTPVEYGDWVKHYVSFYPNMNVQNCLGDTDRISTDNYNNNIGAFKPLDIDFTKVRLGMRYGVMHKGNKQGAYVDSTKDLLENYNTGDYVVTSTQCNIMYFVDSGMYTYNSNGVSDISVNFNVGDEWVFGNHPTDYGQHGLQLVPQWWIRLRDYGAEAYSQFHDADTGYLFQGMGIEELKLSTQDEFYDLENGCLLYRSNLYYDGVEYKPVLTVEQVLKEVAFLGLAVCDFENPTSNLYMGYINSDGLATGELIPYEEWDKSDSLNIVNTVMSDYNEDIEVKPKPTPDPTDEDDTEKMEIGGWYTAGGMVNYYALSDVSKLEQLSENLSNWDYVATGKDVLRNLISLKAFPVQLEKLIHKGLSQTEIIIAGTHTGVNAWAVDSTYNVINMGSISIPAKFEDFRDYAPYTKTEIFIPFCGWVSLPSHAMGRTVSVKMTYDIIAGTCKAFVFLDDNTIVAEISGVMSMDIPFTAEAVGMKTAGVISGVLGVASSVLGAGVGIATGNIIGTASGAIGVANSVSQLISANNANYTEVKGNTGDANNFAGLKTCFLKITRPVSHVPNNYARTVGWLYNKSETLVDGLGFTVIDNPQINGNMTEAERDELKALLSRGVIL